MRIHASYHWLIVCVLAQGLSLQVASAADPQTLPTAPPPTRAITPQAASGIHSSRIALPDDGPRYERTVEGAESVQFQEAVEALDRKQYTVARAGFEALAKLDSSGELTPSLKAFLAELALLEDPTDHGRREAITQYRSIIGSYPKNSNAFRAYWRVGDLYAEMKWFQEAIVAYEYALSRELPRHDADRSMLALGGMLGELGRWIEAERAFDTVRHRSTEDRLVVRATLDQANALYAQGRKRDALPLYDLLYRRWPNHLKSNADALHRYGEALFEIQELRRAGEINLLLYNLFPSHRHAGTAIARLGDIHSRIGLRIPAEFFYTVAQTQYPDTAAAIVARMRLSWIEQETAASAGEHLLRKKVEGMIRGRGISYLDASEGEERFHAIAREHKDDILGSEALFHLAAHYELRGDSARAMHIYQDVTRRTGVIPDDPWPQTAGLHLASILKPQLEAALKNKQDVQALTLFQSHGHAPEQYYTGTRTLLEVADTHRRLGFSPEAIHLYHTLVKNRKAAPLHEEALLGLGESYVDQLDPAAARHVFESFRLQYPRSARSALVSRQLATAMLDQGDRRSAIRIMRHWLRLRPRDAAQAWIYVTLARTLAEDKKLEEAAEAFEVALRNHALHAPQDLLFYADVLVKLNKPERGVDLYRQVLKSEPDPAEAEWARVQIALNGEAKKPAGTRPEADEPKADFDDPLLHRAAEARHIELQAVLAKEGE